LFDGFSEDTIKFLNNLKINNSKAWFEENKGNYQKYLLKPFQELANNLGPFMLSIDQDFYINPKKIISRINRDIRFSKDKSPYRYNMWITYKKMYKDWESKPSYFFEIFPDFYHYGMGFYKIPRGAMNELRRQIIEKDREFIRVNALYKKQKVFMMAGENYKRILDKSLSSNDLQEWYQRKNIYFVCKRQIDNHLFSKDLLTDLMFSFELIAPIYNYFSELGGKTIYNNSTKKRFEGKIFKAKYNMDKRR